MSDESSTPDGDDGADVSGRGGRSGSVAGDAGADHDAGRDRDAVPLMESYTEMTELLLPNDTNSLGRALGGVVLHWMDVCGGIAAMRFSRRQCVTAAMDHVDFIGPIDEGEVATVEAYVYETGRTSLELMADVRAENPRAGEERETTTSFFTFVALDRSGSPTPVPDVACPTEAQAELRAAAREQRRRQLEAVARRVE